MSLIAYFKRSLVADTSAVNFNGKTPGLNSSPSSMKKLWMSKDGRLAIATSGNEINYSSKEFIAWISSVTKKLKEGGDPITITVPVHFSQNTWLLMTSSSCYEFSCKDEVSEETDVHLVQLSDSFPHFNGSGRDTASFIAAARPDLPISTIFALTAQVAPTMWGTEFDIIHQSELNPL